MEELTNKELGNLGERKVGEWAERSGMTVTEPGEDKKGWDLLLEFNLRDNESSTTNEPLDKDSREFKALCQVKTTSRTPGRWSIKLSNLVSLVEHGGPSYVVVLEVDSKYRDAEVVAAYVVHVGYDIIADVLKKQRKIEYDYLQAKADEKDPKPIQLNNYKLSIVYKDLSIPEPSYCSFRKAIVNHLKGNPHRYLEWKRQIYETVGYDEQTGMAVATGEFSIRLPEEYQDSPEEYFADASFGKEDSINITGGEVREYRFDIPSAPTAIPESSLKVEPPTQEVEAKFERPGLGNRIISDGTLQVVSIPFSDGEIYEAVKLSVAGTNLIYRHKRDLLEVKFGFDIDMRPYPLEKLWKTAELAYFMREAGDNEEDVRVSVKNQSTGDWSPLPRLSISESVSFEDLQREEIKMFISQVSHAHRLALNLNIYYQLEVSIEQIHKYKSELSTYFELYRSQKGQPTSNVILIFFEQEPDSSNVFLKEGTETCFVDLISLWLGDQLVVISFGLSGKLSPLEVNEGNMSDLSYSNKISTSQLPNHSEGYELSIEEVFYLQPYSFESAEDTPDREIFLKDPFDQAVSNCPRILSLTESGQLALHTVE